MTKKPRRIFHQFGPYAVSNYRLGKAIPVSLTSGFRVWPLSEVQLDVAVGDKTDRMTATRIIGGGILLGPVGMILGGMARKDITKGRMILSINGERIETYEFRGRDIDKAIAFVEAVAEHAGQAA